MYEQENETVVCRAIDQYNTSASVKHQRYPFKLTPPVLPVTDRDLEKNIVVGKYLKFPPAAGMSGCFVALITREASLVDKLMNVILYFRVATTRFLRVL